MALNPHVRVPIGDDLAKLLRKEMANEVAEECVLIGKTDQRKDLDQTFNAVCSPLISQQVMTDNVIAQHHPATKVAGRRLSVTTKHRPHRPDERGTTGSEEKEEDNHDADYPRPSHITAAPTHHEHGHNYEEEVPHKKEKKPNSEKKTQEYEQWKSETTRPTRDHNVGQKLQNMRISQPAGKGFNI